MMPNCQEIGDVIEEDGKKVMELRETAIGLFTKNEWKQIMELRSLAVISPYYLDFLRGYVLVSKGNHQEAIDHLERAIQTEPNRPAPAYPNRRSLPQAEAIR